MTARGRWALRSEDLRPYELAGREPMLETT